jgi:mono/diheme cytochrome c family protein
VAPAGAERPTQSLTARAQPAPRNALAALSAEERRGAAERGGALYATHACASCHEAALAEAGVVVKPLLDLASRFDIERLSGFFAAPTPPMPVFELTPDEKRDLAVYVLDRFE